MDSRTYGRERQGRRSTESRRRTSSLASRRRRVAVTMLVTKAASLARSAHRAVARRVDGVVLRRTRVLRLRPRSGRRCLASSMLVGSRRLRARSAHRRKRSPTSTTQVGRSAQPAVSVPASTAAGDRRLPRRRDGADRRADRERRDARRPRWTTSPRCDARSTRRRRPWRSDASRPRSRGRDVQPLKLVTIWTASAAQTIGRRPSCAGHIGRRPRSRTGCTIPMRSIGVRCMPRDASAATFGQIAVARSASQPAGRCAVDRDRRSSSRSSAIVCRESDSVDAAIPRSSRTAPMLRRDAPDSAALGSERSQPDRPE